MKGEATGIRRRGKAEERGEEEEKKSQHWQTYSDQWLEATMGEPFDIDVDCASQKKRYGFC